MANRRSRAKDVANRRVENGYRIDHAQIEDEDFEWLESTGRLTLWNVLIPDGFLARLENLWWLDIRGGSANDLNAVRGLSGLKYLAVSHVRGLSNLTILPEIEELQYLSLYALPKVTHFPSLLTLSKLERAMIGQMKGLESLGGLLDAPALKDIQLVKRVSVTEQDIENIKSHKIIESFTWDPCDVPVRMRKHVVDQIDLPELPFRHPESWFGIPVY